MNTYRNIIAPGMPSDSCHVSLIRLPSPEAPGNAITFRQILSIAGEHPCPLLL